EVKFRRGDKRRRMADGPKRFEARRDLRPRSTDIARASPGHQRKIHRTILCDNHGQVGRYRTATDLLCVEESDE
ncbi:MAG: hypothetical protein ACYC26_15630, partial [Phycisphaerales bacterium]